MRPSHRRTSSACDYREQNAGCMRHRNRKRAYQVAWGAAGRVMCHEGAPTQVLPRKLQWQPRSCGAAGPVLSRSCEPTHSDLLASSSRSSSFRRAARAARISAEVVAVDRALTDTAGAAAMAGGCGVRSAVGPASGDVSSTVRRQSMAFSAAWDAVALTSCMVRCALAGAGGTLLAGSDAGGSKLKLRHRVLSLCGKSAAAHLRPRGNGGAPRFIKHVSLCRVGQRAQRTLTTSCCETKRIPHGVNALLLGLLSCRTRRSARTPTNDGLHLHSPALSGSATWPYAVSSRQSRRCKPFRLCRSTQR
jgi:hypothetical protein